jgi:hypothetical protein
MRYFLPVVVAGSILCLVSISASAQRLECSPCSYDFGNVNTGASISYLIQLTNTGSAGLTILSMSQQGGAFSSGNFPLPMTLVPWVSIELPVTFTPTATGYTDATFTLTSNTENPTLTISVSGTGTGSGGAPAKLTLSPATLNFGSVSVGSSATRQATLTASNGAVKLSSQQMTNSEFAIVGLDLPVTIAEGKSISVTIQFTPAGSGAVSGQAEFASNAENSPSDQQLQGTGLAKASGHLAVTPASLSFGSVNVGSSASLKATLTTSNAAVTISSDRSTTSEFAIVGLDLPVTIAAGKSIPVTIQFTPSGSGTDPAKVGFISSAADSPTLEPVTGTGVAQGSYSVSLSWSGDAGAAGYNVFRGTARAGPFHEINTTLDSSTSYTDSTVAAGNTYYYVTTAVNAQGAQSGYSNVTEAVIPKP